MPPVQSTTYSRDDLTIEAKKALNEAITNSALLFIGHKLGVEDKVITSYDDNFTQSVKLGAYMGVINRIGERLRSMYPNLIVFM